MKSLGSSSSGSTLRPSTSAVPGGENAFTCLKSTTSRKVPGVGLGVVNTRETCRAWDLGIWVITPSPVSRGSSASHHRASSGDMSPKEAPWLKGGGGAPSHRAATPWRSARSARPVIPSERHARHCVAGPAHKGAVLGA